MTTSRTDAPDIGWADLGDDDQPQQRHSGMDRSPQDPDVDPAAIAAELPPRDGTAGMPAQVASFDALGERPSFHEASPPEPVAASWSAVLEAVEAANVAGQLERALDGEEAQAQREEAARVRSATAAGKVVKAAAPGREWAAERRHRAAVAAGHRQRARQCRTEYDELVEQHRAGWAALLVETLPSSKAQTLEALTEAGSMAERLLAAAEAAQALLLVEGGSVVTLPTLEVNRFVQAAQTLAELIEASDQLGGAHLVRPKMSRPTETARRSG